MLRVPADSITVPPAMRASGHVRVPGDKSISHRYAMLAALADASRGLAGTRPARTARPRSAACAGWA